MGKYFQLGHEVRFGDESESYVYAVANSEVGAFKASGLLNLSRAANDSRNYTLAARLVASAESFATPI